MESIGKIYYTMPYLNNLMILYGTREAIKWELILPTMVLEYRVKAAGSEERKDQYSIYHLIEQRHIQLSKRK